MTDMDKGVDKIINTNANSPTNHSSLRPDRPPDLEPRRT
jgi:hypothetical protein